MYNILFHYTGQIYDADSNSSAVKFIKRGQTFNISFWQGNYNCHITWNFEFISL